MADPESPQPPPPLKRQNALWGKKLLEAVEHKGTWWLTMFSHLMGGPKGLPHKQTMRTKLCMGRSETTNVAWSWVNNVRYMAIQLDPANSNSVISNSSPYHFPWIRPSVICYRQFRTPASSNYFTKMLNPFERARSNPRCVYIILQTLARATWHFQRNLIERDPRITW